MVLNMAIDFGIGLVPFIGDIADAVYKCNTRNVILLEKVLRERGAKRIKGTPHANIADPSLPDEYDYQGDEQPPRYTSRRENGRSHRDRRDVERGETGAPSLPARTR